MKYIRRITRENIAYSLSNGDGNKIHCDSAKAKDILEKLSPYLYFRQDVRKAKECQSSSTSVIKKRAGTRLK